MHAGEPEDIACGMNSHIGFYCGAGRKRTSDARRAHRPRPPPPPPPSPPPAPSPPSPTATTALGNPTTHPERRAGGASKQGLKRKSIAELRAEVEREYGCHAEEEEEEHAGT